MWDAHHRKSARPQTGSSLLENFRNQSPCTRDIDQLNTTKHGNERTRKAYASSGPDRQAALRRRQGQAKVPLKARPALRSAPRRQEGKIRS